MVTNDTTTAKKKSLLLLPKTTTTTTTGSSNGGSGVVSLKRPRTKSRQHEHQPANVIRIALEATAVLSNQVLGIIALMLSMIFIFAIYTTQSFIESMDEEVNMAFMNEQHSSMLINGGAGRRHTTKRLSSRNIRRNFVSPKSVAAAGRPVATNKDFEQSNKNNDESIMNNNNDVNFDTTTTTYYRNKKEYINGLIKKIPSSSNESFIVYENFRSGQGTGNIMAGLLSAQLLGYEFNRTVCVSPEFHEFHMAFEYVDPIAIQYCPTLFETNEQKLMLRSSGGGGSKKRRNRSIVFGLVNFAEPPDECALKAMLLERIKKPVLYMTGNTYPRWPIIPDEFFFRYYRAKTNLLSLLPYDNINDPPNIVVHLRAPDNPKTDPRKGLDERSLNALGDLLSSSSDPQHHVIYLVTNQVEWYDKFEKEYHWSHPNWDEVVHSAMKKSWGTRHNKKSMLRKGNTVDQEQQAMQVWVDWYTMLTAKTVYHTHSDFSISAIHWMNINSKTISDYNVKTGKLDFVDESWRIDGETPRLIDRTINWNDIPNRRRRVNGGYETNKINLRLCNAITRKELNTLIEEQQQQQQHAKAEAEDEEEKPREENEEDNNTTDEHDVIMQQQQQQKRRGEIFDELGDPNDDDHAVF